MDKYPETLEWMLRMSGYRPLIAEYKTMIKYKIIGYGPDNKVVCWDMQSKDVSFFSATEINWRKITTFID